MTPAAKRSRGTPVIFSADGASPALERINLGNGQHSEAWLQQLIFDHPRLIPVADIEPGFGTLCPVAREVPCGHGLIDNLYLTPQGEIVLVETKLWANGEARRLVVAQTLDYVSALMGLGYAAFEAAIAKGLGGPTRQRSLYALVADQPEALSEAEFIDAVSANLARGRMLVIALGDGIRREAEALASLLQSHAGAHFTFALVELATWRNPVTGEILLVPDTLAQTVMIERGIVVVEEGRPLVKAVPPSPARKAQSLSETMFYEELATKDPPLPDALKAFLASLEPLGVYPELKASLNLKVDLADAPKPINLGYIQKNGQLWTEPLSWGAPRDIVQRYNRVLADLIGGTVTERGDAVYVTTNGKSAPLLSTLLPEHAEAWRAAIEEVITAIGQRVRGNS